MSIEARMHDGTVLQFPDDTPDDVINRVVQEHINRGGASVTPAPTAEDNSNFLGDLSVGVVAGAGKTGAGAIQRLNELTQGDNGQSAVSKFYQAVLPYVRPDLAEEFKAINSDSIQQSSRNAAKRLDTERPKSLSGNIGDIVGNVAAPIVASAPLGLIAGGAVGGGVSGLLTPTDADTTSESKKQVLNNVAEGAAKGAAIGTLFKGVGALPGAIKSVVSKGSGVNPEALDNLTEAGITPSLAAVSDSPAVKTLQNILSRFPGSSKVIENSVKKASDDVTKQLENFGLDKAVTPQQAGEVLESGVRRGVDRGKEQAGKVYNIFEKYVAPTDNFAIPNSVKFLEDVGKRTENPAVLADLESKSGFQLVKQMSESAKDGNINYRDIKYFRSKIGDMLGDKFTVGGVERPILKQAYGALTADMRTAAAQKGDKALRAFDKSNELYSKFIQEADDNLVGLLNQNAPEKMYQALKQGTKIGGTRAEAIMSKLNSSQREIMRGSLLQDLGGGAGKFNPLTAVSEFDKLAPEAKSAFFKGASSELLGSYQKISNGVKRLQNVKEYANPSGSGYASNMGLFFGGSLLSVPGAIGTAASANITARMMTNPSFIRWLSKGVDVAKGGEKEVANHMRALSAITKRNPGIAEDVQKYLTSIGVVSTDRK